MNQFDDFTDVSNDLNLSVMIACTDGTTTRITLSQIQDCMAYGLVVDGRIDISFMGAVK